MGGDDGPSGIPADDDVGVDGDLAQEGDTQPAGHLPAPSALEDRLFVTALATDVVRHVLEDPEDWDAHLLEHRNPFAGVDERHLLRGRDDDGAGKGDPLREGELD